MKKLLFVFLPAIGTIMANTYYIDFTAINDAAAGTSKAAPWKRHPFMQGWAGSYTHTPGDSFIFKGGVAWDTTCFQMDIGRSNSGTVMARDYYGVDSTWHTGDVFTRPVFDLQNKAPQVSGRAVYLHGAKYLTIDCIEMKNILCIANSQTGFIVGDMDTGIIIKNCFLHGWSLPDTVTADNAHGGIYMPGSVRCCVDHCEISNAEWEATRNNGHCISFMDTVKYCVLHDAPTILLHVRAVHHNTIYNVCYPHDAYYAYATHHQNLWYGESFGNSPGWFYNNYCYNIGTVGAIIYPNPAGASDGYPCPSNDSIFIFNNIVVTDSTISPTAVLNIGGTNTIDSVRCGTVLAWNNIFQTKYAFRPVTTMAAAGSRDTLHTVDIRNNLYICPACAVGSDSMPGFGNDPVHGYAKIYKNNHNIGMTSSYAEAHGLLRANLYKPTPACTTINRGVDLSGYFTSAYLGVSRPQDGFWDVGAYEYATTGIRNAQSGMRYNPAAFQIIRHHPINAMLWKQSLQIYSNVKVRDVLGRVADKNVLNRPGIYMVEYGTSKAVQKVLVLNK